MTINRQLANPGRWEPKASFAFAKNLTLKEDAFIPIDERPFVETMSGVQAFVFAYAFIRKMSMLRMESFAWCDTKAYWSPEALAQRAANRKLFFDKKYPERPFIITPGDKQWLQ